MSSEPDDTVRLPREKALPLVWGTPTAATTPKPRRAHALVAGGAAVLLALGLTGAWWLWPAPVATPPAAVVEPPAGPPPAARPAPATAFRLMEREEILAWQPGEPTIIRLADLPAVFLIAFPDLASQGRMMNRIAALIEKARTPRDRVLDDAELAAAIEADGASPDTYYSGHDYPLDGVVRFFALAAGRDVALNDAERWLEARLPEIRAAGGPGPLAIITLPGMEDRVPARIRRAVLEHEAGHGRFFTDPDFAAHVIRVWREVFTESERAAFRAFLAREGYDTANETLMANESMAYLVHTPDRDIFDPRRDVGLDEEHAARLRTALTLP